MEFVDMSNGHISIYEQAKAYFESINWPFVEDEAQQLIKLRIEENGNEWTCVAHTQENMGLFLFYSVMDGHVPESKRAVVAEFLTRANYGNMVGNFEMDLDDGQVLFKTAALVRDEIVHPAFIEACVQLNLLAMKRYLPGIQRLLHTEASARKVIDAIESGRALPS